MTWTLLKKADELILGDGIDRFRQRRKVSPVERALPFKISINYNNSSDEDLTALWIKYGSDKG